MKFAAVCLLLYSCASTPTSAPQSEAQREVRSLAEAKQRLRKYPKDPIAFRWMVKDAIAQKKFVAAFAMADLGLTRIPGDPELLFLKGGLNYREKNYVGARDDWKACLKSIPEIVDCRVALAVLYFELGSAKLANDTLSSAPETIQSVGAAQMLHLAATAATADRAATVSLADSLYEKHKDDPIYKKILLTFSIVPTDLVPKVEATPQSKAPTP